MSNTPNLGDFEAIVLKSVYQIGNNAYGVPIRKEVEAVLGRTVSVGALYTTLSRLEEKGFIRAWNGDPTPERGGRSKRFYEILGAGVRALAEKEHQAAWMVGMLSGGLRPAGGV